MIPYVRGERAAVESILQESILFQLTNVTRLFPRTFIIHDFMNFHSPRGSRERDCSLLKPGMEGCVRRLAHGGRVSVNARSRERKRKKKIYIYIPWTVKFAVERKGWPSNVWRHHDRLRLALPPLSWQEWRRRDQVTDNTEYLSISRMRKNRPRLVHDHPRNRLKRGRDSLSLDEKIKQDSGESQKRKRKRKRRKRKS